MQTHRFERGRQPLSLLCSPQGMLWCPQGCSYALERGERVRHGAGGPAQPNPCKPSTQLLFSLRAFYTLSSLAPPCPVFAGWDPEGVN